MTIIVTSATGSEDKEKIFRFLYGIWIRELGRELHGTDHEKEQIRDSMDDWACHFIALDNQGRIAGCVRVNRLSKGLPEPWLAEPMGFDTLNHLFGPERVGFISHLAISPAHRGGTVISLLLAELFRYLFETLTTIVSCYCRIGRVSLYHRIGMRPYRPNFNRNQQMQVPLIGCINDRKYLKATGSPLHMLLPPEQDDFGAAAKKLSQEFPLFAKPEFTKVSGRNLWAQLAHQSADSDSKPAEKLFQGIAPNALEGLLSNLPRIFLSANESIQTSRLAETTMGILISGALGLGVGNETNPHFIYVIQPGEPFGALTTLTRIKSSAIILALEPSEVILLPDHLFDRLGKKDPETTICLYKNLLAVIARRTAAINAAFQDSLDVNTQKDTSVHRPAHHTSKYIRTRAEREESYHFDTLSDPDGELERLKCQAKIAENLELKALKKIGLKNGDTILDLGSGPGVTSLLLSRHFPGSRIIGVEPEIQLRSKAMKIALNQNNDRCEFVEGTAQRIPLPDQIIDFAYARLLFQHIPDPLICLAEMKRVTRPGGIICVLDVDDGTIFIHPQMSEWQAVEDRVAMAQAEYGGDRHVGRKLLGYFQETGLTGIQVDIVPVTTQMLGPDLFFDIVFGFKQQHLKRFDDWDKKTDLTFKRIRDVLKQKAAFASENMFVAHATVPNNR